MELREFISSTIREYLNENESTFNPHKFNSFSELTEQDLYDMAKWGLENGLSSGAWDDADTLDEAIMNVVDSFKLLLKDKFPDGFSGMPNPVKIYRLVVLDTPNDLNRKNLGYSWFTNSSRIKDLDFKQQLFHLKTKNLYLITAEIAFTIKILQWNIDFAPEENTQNEIDLTTSMLRKLIM